MNNLWGFLNALVTFVTGLVAFYVYKKKQRDDKKDAANIILLEVQNAERQLKLVRENIKRDILEENFLCNENRKLECIQISFCS